MGFSVERMELNIIYWKVGCLYDVSRVWDGSSFVEPERHTFFRVWVWESTDHS